jgi:putative polyhydroxyalkanoate system protein
MSDIRVRRAHQLAPELIREKAEQVVKGLQARHGGEYQWRSEHRVDYKYPAVNATVTFDDSSLEVSVELGLLMKALKVVLEEEINTYLNRALA